MDYPISFDELMKLVLEIFPSATIGEDNDGQLIVYTDLKMISSDGFCAPISMEHEFTDEEDFEE